MLLHVFPIDNFFFFNLKASFHSVKDKSNSVKLHKISILLLMFIIILMIFSWLLFSSVEIIAIELIYPRFKVWASICCIFEFKKQVLMTLK